MFVACENHIFSGVTHQKNNSFFASFFQVENILCYKLYLNECIEMEYNRL